MVNLDKNVDGQTVAIRQQATNEAGSVMVHLYCVLVMMSEVLNFDPLSEK